MRNNTIRISAALAAPQTNGRQPDEAVAAPAPAVTAAVYTIAEAAARLQIDPKTCRRLIDAGRCPPPIRLSKQIVRLSVVAWEKWIADGCPDLRRAGGRR